MRVVLNFARSLRHALRCMFGHNHRECLCVRKTFGTRAGGSVECVRKEAIHPHKK